jgi:hypothetical protein
MACGAIPESFPFLKVEALVARRQSKAIVSFVSLSEKQYQTSAALARIVHFLSNLPALDTRRLWRLVDFWTAISGLLRRLRKRRKQTPMQRYASSLAT